MSQWASPTLRVTRIEVARIPQGEGGTAWPPPGEEVQVAAEPHVGAAYEVVLPDGRVVHQAALTLHGPAAGELALPDHLAEAVQALWEHARQAAAEHEGLPPG